MNIYNYFQNEAKNCPAVPSKNQRLWIWSIQQTKKAMLSKKQSYECLNWASKKLQDDENLQESTFKKKFDQIINQYKSHTMTKELCDLPLVVLIFEVLLNDLYSPFVNGTSVATFYFSMGTIFRIAGTYVLIKLILLYLSGEPKQSSLLFWIVLAFLFFIYLFIQNVSQTLEKHVIGSCPMIVWVGLVVLMWLFSFLWYKKENSQ